MRIGFSGHQKIDHPQRWPWVRSQFLNVLRAQPVDRVVASLAEGGDQLFVEAALELGIPVEIVVPCEGYEAAFDTAYGKAAYAELLKTAASDTVLDFREPSEEAFLAAGHFVVNNCDLLVVLWNGKPAAGKGGTGDIVGFARSLGRPIVHVHPDLLTVFGPNENYRGG